MKKNHRVGKKRPEAIVLSYFFILLVEFFLMPQIMLQAQTPSSPEGLWKTLDDHTGVPRGLVRIYRQGDAYFGRLEASLVPGEADSRCSACRDERKDQPVVGMVILRNLKPGKDGYSGGDILDPESGTVYDCALRLEDEGRKLTVRGYIGLSLFGRSQTWLRAE
jgi:uncharacterized protein (DUF2147 family)